MMQPSDWDTKILPLSPSYAKKQNRASDPTVENHLSAVPKPAPSQMNNQEMSSNNKHGTSEIPKTDVSQQSEKPAKEQLTTAQKDNNGDRNGRNLPVTTVPEKELDGSGSGKKTISGNLPQQGFLPVLKNPNFLALWGGQVFCQLADKVYLVLMIGLINSQFQSSNQSISGWVSALMMAFTIPAVLFGSIAGVFVDRWSKKTVLVATNVWRGILVLAIPMLLWLTHDWQPIGAIPVGFAIILGVTFLVSTLTQFFAPAEQAAIPLVVEEQHLLSANSLYTTTMMASVIVGFAVGEPLLAIADSICRRISVAEALAIQSLPGNFVLPENMSLTNMFKTIGNGVPYLASKALAQTIVDFLKVRR